MKADLTTRGDAPAALLVLAIVVGACGASAQATISPSPTPTVARPSATPAATPTAPPTATPEPDYDQVPQAAFDQDDLTAQLFLVEAAIRDPAVIGQKLAWMGHLQQLVYSRFGEFPEWAEGSLAALPERHRAAAAGSFQARKELRTLSGPTPRTLPDWRIVEPRPIEELLGYYREAEAEFGVPWYYLAAINLIETRMGRIRGLSSAGAQGPMQFMPVTWSEYGRGDINDDRDAILSAARYLRASGAPDDMARALFAYNRSQAYVRGVMGYAHVMRDDPDSYRGFHGWNVYYTTTEGTFHLPAGWTKESE
ncbi:MAG: transglycosylase SLT domain-containing protein [Candidatus Limnocylindria bacterium]